jgi:hypothetical protein
MHRGWGGTRRTNSSCPKPFHDKSEAACSGSVEHSCIHSASGPASMNLAQLRNCLQCCSQVLRASRSWEQRQQPYHLSSVSSTHRTCMPQCARERPHCCTYRVSWWPATCPQIINGALHESRMCFKNGLVPRLVCRSRSNCCFCPCADRTSLRVAARAPICDACGCACRRNSSKPFRSVAAHRWQALQDCCGQAHFHAKSWPPMFWHPLGVGGAPQDGQQSGSTS